MDDEVDNYLKHPHDMSVPLSDEVSDLTLW
jgi:hypothetical protein